MGIIIQCKVRAGKAIIGLWTHGYDVGSSREYHVVQTNLTDLLESDMNAELNNCGLEMRISGSTQARKQVFIFCMFVLYMFGLC